MRARDNPFRTERLLQVRYQLEGLTWLELLRRCEAHRYRCALTGPHGSGKTTLLEDLGTKLGEQGFRPRFVRLDADHRVFETGLLQKLFGGAGARDIILFDGAEQLNWPRWLWFKWRARSACGLIITVHTPGRLPTLWECRTSELVLARIAGELLGQDPGSLQDWATVLFRRCGGNLREALREWYDLMAQQRRAQAQPAG